MTHDDGAAGAKLDLTVMQTVIAAAQNEVKALCHGKRWQMRIPAEPDSDSDFVIAAALSVADELLVRLRSALREPPPQEEKPAKSEIVWGEQGGPGWGI